MKIEIMVRINSEYGTYAAAVDVPDYLLEAFKPMKTYDEPIFSMLDPEAIICERDVHKVIRLRENAAEDLSNLLTEHIMKAMEAEDRHNGYKKE